MLISSTIPLERSIMVLEAQGCRLIGTAMINCDNPHFDNKKIPVIKMEIL
ncbi:MAG: hypothetical protein IJ730_07590 [Alphaproteobacteria bacterium]|nr:hypothetical protein [Alphaproteobacteria bacterium]